MKQRGWLIVALISVISLFLFLFTYFPSITIKHFINNIATGRSSAKVVLFLIYLAFCSIIIWISNNYSLSFIKRINISKLKLFFFIALALGFILGLASQIYFFQHYDLSPNYYQTFDGEKQSSTQLFHIHTSKAVLYQTLDFFGIEEGYYDSGRFFALHQPSYFWWPYLIIFPIAFLLIISLLLLLDQKWKDDKYHNLYLFFYIISSFSLLKNTIDGGILNFETLFWLGIMIALLWKTASFQLFFKYSFICTLIIAYLAAFAYFFYQGGLTSFFFTYHSFIFFFLLIIGTFYLYKIKEPLFIPLVFLAYLLLVLTLVTIFPGTHLDFTLNDLTKSTKTVDQNTIGYLYLPKGQIPGSISLCQEVIYRQDDFAACRFVTTEKTTYGTLLSLSTIQPDFEPLMVDKIDCFENVSLTDVGTLLLINGNVPDMINTSLFNISFIKENISLSLYPEYLYEVTSGGCVPGYRESFHRTLNAYGINSYIITD